MFRLPDPRRWNGAAADNPLLRLTLASAAGDREAHAELLAGLRERMAKGEDREISDALRSSPSAAVYRHLWELICMRADHPHADDGTLCARPFAIPLVLVAGAKRRVTLSGTVPDVGAVAALLERHGALGPVRNFALSDAMS